MSAPAIVPDRKAQWLAARRERVGDMVTITASDVAAILGEDPRRGPLAVFLEKRGEYEPEDSLPMRRGRRLEAVIAEEYEEQTGRPVLDLAPFELSRHPDIPWLAATPDRKVMSTPDAPDPFGGADVIHGGPSMGRVRAPLQIKYALGSASKWKEEPPIGYAVQVAIEMACCESRWGALCGLVGPGPLKTFDLPANEAFLEAALPVLERFSRAVVRGEAPEADGLVGTTEAIKRAFADEDGETVALDHEALALVAELDGARQRKAAVEGTVRELENRLRARLGSASFGALADGSYLTLRTTTRKGYTVEPAEFRVLRRWWPTVRR